MFTLSTKRKIKKWFYSPLTLLFLLVLTAFMFVPVVNMYERYTESRDALLISEERMKSLLAEDLEITEDIEYLKSDLGKEAEFRRRFRTGKAGELMAIIIDAENMRDETEVVEEVSFWQGLKRKIWDIF